MPDGYAIVFEPMGRHLVAPAGERLLEVANRHGVVMTSSCGGRGTCRSCAVRIDGVVPAPSAPDRADFTDEEIDAGWRRACQSYAAGPCVIHVPPRTMAPAVVRGQEGGADVVPIVTPLFRRDAGGVWWRGTSRRPDLSGPTTLCLAVDLGTTNLAAALVELPGGRVLATAAQENPQAVFGADIISRMASVIRVPGAARQLQQLVVGAMAAIARDLTDGDPARIAEVAIVGNTVMQHLLLGLSIESLAHAPYAPLVNGASEVQAAELGLRLAPAALAWVGPNIAGFVGSDHVAALLEVLAAPPAGRWLLADIGTNTEISLHADGEVTAVSCASGPAFEGWTLSCGMRAARGAIERVRLEGDALALDTIDGAEAVGICGSGVLSLVAALRRAGVANPRGALTTSHPRVRLRRGEREFVLADVDAARALPLVFTQDDVRAIQLAKAAIRAGIDILLADRGLDERELDRVIVAGAFGRFIGIDDAVAIGLLPDLPRDRFVQVGNSAGAGVRRLAACTGARARAAEVAGQVRYLEIATRPGFQKTFLARTAL